MKQFYSSSVVSGGESPTPPIKKEAICIVMQGQSNCTGMIPPIGSVDGIDPKYKGDINENLYNFINYSDDVFQTLNYNVNNTKWRTLANDLHGADLSLGYKLTDETNYDVYIVKIDFPGSSVFRNEDPESIYYQNNWSPQTKNGLNARAAEQIQTVKQFFVDNDVNVINYYLYWNQFEADVGKSTEEYQKALLSHYRSQEQAVNINFKYILAVPEVTKRPHYGFPSQENWDNIRQVFLNLISSDPSKYRGVYLDGKQLSNDDIHFTSSAQIEIGNEIAEVIINEF